MKKINRAYSRPVKAAAVDRSQVSREDVDELVLTITNDGDLYRERIKPAIENLKRKYKKGKYDRDLAVKLWQYVADEGVRRYDKEFGSGRGSVAMLSPATRKAIAEELRDDYEEEIMYEDDVQASTKRRGRKTIMATTNNVLNAEYDFHPYEHLAPENCLDGFVYNYSDSDAYIADAIAEQADGEVDIYYDSLFKSAYEIWESGAYEEAAGNGLLDGTTDMARMLQMCQSEYYSILLYENLDALMQNMVLSVCDDRGIDVDPEEWANVVVPEYLTDIDNNDRINDVVERAINAISGEGEY